MTLTPKTKAILAALGWAALVAVLQAIEPLLKPPYQGVITALIVVLTGAAKYAPRSAVVMQPPTHRAEDRREPK